MARVWRLRDATGPERPGQGPGTGFVMSSVTFASVNRTRNARTETETGISLRISTGCPITFSIRRTARCPPSNGGNGIRLMIPMNRTTYAKV